MHKEPLKELQRVFEEAYANEQSAFYRDMYLKQGFTPGKDWPQSIEEWRKTPTISKEDLAEYPLERRFFRPLNELTILHMSSGTTKRGVVLIPRSHFCDYDNMRGFASRMLYPRSPFQYALYAAIGMASIAADYTDIDATVRLAVQFRIDAMEVSISQLYKITPKLSQVMDLSQIRLVMLNGERFSPAGYEYVRKHYPNALPLAVYGTAETGGIHARACEELSRTGKNLVHFSETVAYPEILDTLNGEVIDEEEREGELLLTILWEKHMFPALRFRTGDLVRRVKPPCSCGREVYEIVGRSDFDRLTVAGVQFKSEELERVLAAHLDRIYDDFELHVFHPSGAPAIRLELRVRPRSGIDLSELARTVSDGMRVSPTETIRTGAERGLFEPLVCVPLSEGSQQGKKMRIVSHV